MRARWPGVAAVALLVTAGVGCDPAEHDAPTPAPLPVGTLAPGSGGAPGMPPGDAGVPKRTLLARSLVGGPPGNLLVDGDFELSVTPSGGQMGWFVFHQTGGYRALEVETGGLCRSGLRCAVLKRNLVLWGSGAAARDTTMQASIWVQIPAGRECSLVTPMAVGCNTWRPKLLAAVSAAPGADGWCHYAERLPASVESVCFYVESGLEFGERVLVDAATLLPGTGAAPLAVRPAVRPTAAQQARVRAVGEWVAQRRRFGAPRPGDGPSLGL